MISKALIFVTDQLNKEIKLTHGLDTDPVVLGSLINPDGSVTNNIENKIIVSLVNLEHETTMKNPGRYTPHGDNSYLQTAPPICLNLYVLVSANYDSKNYTEALKMISSVIGVFQGSPYFTKEDYPDMPAPLDKLTFEIFNLPINELSHIWGGIGAKYVPSILYKVRMLTIQENKVSAEIPGIGGLGGTTNPQIP